MSQEEQKEALIAEYEAAVSRNDFETAEEVANELYWRFQYHAH